MSASSGLMATAAKDGEVWFFRCALLQTPLSFDGLRFIVPIPVDGNLTKKSSAFVESCCWDASGTLTLTLTLTIALTLTLTFTPFQVDTSFSPAAINSSEKWMCLTYSHSLRTLLVCAQKT